MPIIIRETTIRADLSAGKGSDGKRKDQSKPDEKDSSSKIQPVIEEQIQRILLRLQKTREER